jgi:glycosyltransferase involved in cell wall biosynthesis
MRNDVPLILKSLDIYASLSAYEGMSVGILEAMAAGLPIIASDILPNRELVENNKNGVLADINNIGAVTGIIEELSGNSDKRAKMGLASKQKSYLFDIKKTAGDFTAVYNNL